MGRPRLGGQTCPSRRRGWIRCMTACAVIPTMHGRSARHSPCLGCPADLAGSRANCGYACRFTPKAQDCAAYVRRTDAPAHAPCTPAPTRDSDAAAEGYVSQAAISVAAPFEDFGKGQLRDRDINDQQGLIACGIKRLFCRDHLAAEQPAQTAGVEIAAFKG